MEDYIRMQRLLDELRHEILTYNESNFEGQDLMDQFFKVKQHDEATYELFVLLYNEFQMTHKFNKKQFMEMMDKSLTIKSETVHKMMQERKRFLPWSTRIIDAITFTNVKRVLVGWMIIMIFLFTLHSINPEAFKAIADTTVNIIDVVDDSVDNIK